jgi:hypothetical protein
MGDIVQAGLDGVCRLDNVHAVWVGCGDMCRRSLAALKRLRDEFRSQLTFIDVLDPDRVRQPPLSGSCFFNISRPEELKALRSHLAMEPATHIYLANLPHQHLTTAFVLAEKCPAARIVIAKPLDVNLTLIETLAAGAAWPGVTERLFEHDHYRNKGAVVPMFDAFPDLIKTWGRVTQFEFYLVEHQTVEEESRIEALRDGVIFDLATHLFALVHLFFLDAPHPALVDPGLKVQSVSLQINKVARARYTRCQIENVNAETFAAIDICILTTFQGPRRLFSMEVPGLLVVGKGVKPASSIAAGLKGMRFKQELQTRSVNLTRNEVNPPLVDLTFVKEDGFTSTIVNALTKDQPAVRTQTDPIAPVLSFDAASRKGAELGAVMRGASPIRFYRPGDTLDSVMAQCVAHGDLDHKWLSKGAYTDIGYA